MTEIEGIHGQAVAIIARYAEMEGHLRNKIEAQQHKNLKGSLETETDRMISTLNMLTGQRAAVRNAIIEMGILYPEEVRNIEREQRAWED